MAKRKNISKLVPIKKNVIDRRTDTPIERTYYIDPNKNKGKSSRRKKEEDSDGNLKIDKSTSKKKIKTFDDFKDVGIDPSAAKQFFCNM